MTSSKADDKLKFRELNLKELYKTKLKPPEYIVEGFICKQSLIYYAGPPGSFKSGFLLNIAIRGASGLDVLGFEVNEPFKTLWIDEENGKYRTGLKFNRLVEGSKGDIDKIVENLTIMSISGFKIAPIWITKLEKEIAEHGYNLVVIDNVTRTLLGPEKDSDNVRNIHTLLKPLIEKYGISIVIIHHLRKLNPSNEKETRTLEDIRGSIDFGGQCDEAFILEEFTRKDEMTKTFKLFQVKEKDGAGMEAINFDVVGKVDYDNQTMTPLIVEYAGKIKDNVKSGKVSSCRNDMISILETDGEMQWKQLFKKLEKKKHKKWSIDEARKNLIDKRIKVRKDGKCKYYSIK